jgi:hypothetical protein
MCRSIGASAWASLPVKKRPQRKGGAAGAVTPPDARAARHPAVLWRAAESGPSRGAGGLSWDRPFLTAAAAALTGNASVNETILPGPRSILETDWAQCPFSDQIGDFKMITLKVIAVVISAGILASLYSGDLGADFVLAIVSWLS